MKNIVLIACASKKRATRAPAAEMYDSTLFQYSLQYARKRKPDAIFILSAKYGLLRLDEEIDPYDVTLNKMSAGERKAWVKKVVAQLEDYANVQHDHFVILAGQRYRQYLLQHLASYEVPLKGLRIGEQLQYLKKQVCGE